MIIHFNFLLLRQNASAARRVLVLFRLFQTHLGNGEAMVAQGAEVVAPWSMSQERELGFDGDAFWDRNIDQSVNATLCNINYQ